MTIKPFKILIVDDEPDYCDVLDTILSAKGYVTRKTTHPNEVLGILMDEDFDLVLSDLIMPEMDGVTLLKAIKKSSIKLTL